MTGTATPDCEDAHASFELAGRCGTTRGLGALSHYLLSKEAPYTSAIVDVSGGRLTSVRRGTEGGE
jgi:hypothetical protein